MRPDDAAYFERIESRLDEAFDVAEAAKARGGDPKPEVEIPVAKDMADRVENILGIDGVAERVRELEGEMSREEAALELVEDFVAGDVGDYDSREGKIEGAVRTAVALLTEGVVAAPIEGIDRVELLNNDDGTEFVNVYYAGPIRSAGGTAQALSVLVADYARSLLDIDQYKPRSDEIERYAEEVSLYDKETGLQYSPKDKETKFIAEHMPIMLDGEATGDEEVSGFRDLERVDTNSARGGMCLVLAEGIALKAPKIQRYTRQLDEVDWPWLQDLIDGTYYEDAATDDAGDDGADEQTGDDGDSTGDDTGPDAVDDRPVGPIRPEPAKKFLRDLIAGRPVFGHPSATGGFRLRYGRARNHGFATGGVHPATMHLVDDFLATGTQIKTERPGKAHGVVPVDTIEGPTVKLANGDVRRIDDPAEALEVRNGVVDILDLGEYLVNYGEFVENNHALAPASYVQEWWEQDFAAAGADLQALKDSPYVDLANPDPDQALEWATDYDCPLHPTYTYLWHDISVDQLDTLADAVADARVENEGDPESTAEVAADGATGALVLPNTDPVRTSLESLLVEHYQDEDELRVPDWTLLARTLGLDEDRNRTWELDDLSERARNWGKDADEAGTADSAGEDSDDGAPAGGSNAIEAVNEIAPFEVRERAPTRIGCRMGRPEKSESRDLSPAVHSLFPIGEAGGSQRNMSKAAKHTPEMNSTAGELDVRLGVRACPGCDTHTYTAKCGDCNEWTTPYYECHECGIEVDADEAGRIECPRCERELDNVEFQTIDFATEYRDALRAVGERENAFDVLKGVKGLTSAEKVPEPIEKGVLRAKHGVTTFKDGTVRYDMTDLPVTAVRPTELDVTADHFHDLGYTSDIHGDPLQHDDQLVELRVQDIVLSDGAAEHMLKTANFVDELLEDYYGLDPFYDVDDRDDLVGELVFGMAPHTSAAVVGRVVGFTSAAVGYAHPYFHAAKRRNCFHPNTEIWYENESGEWCWETIQALVEERLDDPETDDFGTLVQELDCAIRVPSVTAEGESVERPVEAVSKHPAPDHLIEITTRSGRELTVTPDHSMRRWSEDGLERVEARDLEKGELLPSPKELDTCTDAEVTFDLLDEFLYTDSIPNEDLVIRGLGENRIKTLFDDAIDEPGYLKPVADHLGKSQSSVYNWVNRDSVPVDVLLELYDERRLLDKLPDEVRLAMRRDTTTVNRILTIDEDVGTLLGYYAAEGFSRRTDGEFYQTTICIPDESARSTLTSTFEKRFGVAAFEENEWKLTVSSRLITALFTDVFDAGTRAEDKCIPEFVLTGPESVVSNFLAGYFAGDGSTASDRVDIRAHTVSDALKSDIIAGLKRFGITCKVASETRTPSSGAVAEFYDERETIPEFQSWVLKISSENAARFADRIGFHLERKQDTLENSLTGTELRAQRIFGDGGDVWLDEIESIAIAESDIEYTYSLTVSDTNTLVANDLYVGQCDGDEDCVMLLMDGLLNFSKSFLPDKRGGRMDAPLVMSSRIDPSEIDDEAHNMDIAETYPREFYLATLEMADPEDVDITIAEKYLGTDREYSDFNHTHDTADIALGPDLSAYKTLGSMTDKMDAQLALARKLRSVDETDVAERIIEYHFLPDLIGNLRAFSRQETRCLGCGEKYRRMPLTGQCRECGGKVNLTVHRGSVNKYMDTSKAVADDFGAREYTKQRLVILEKSLESIFENDKNKQSGIADFM